MAGTFPLFQQGGTWRNAQTARFLFVKGRAKGFVFSLFSWRDGEGGRWVLGSVLVGSVPPLPAMDMDSFILQWRYISKHWNFVLLATPEIYSFWKFQLHCCQMHVIRRLTYHPEWKYSLRTIKYLIISS